MEGFNTQKEKFFSEEQNEKLAELVDIIQPLYHSLDSNGAYELSRGIGRLKDSLKEQGHDPRKYLLWSLITENGTLDNSDANQEFDTPDGQIESFIRSIGENIEIDKAA
jgi:hypothetical protein